VITSPYAIAAVLAWAVVGYKLRDLRRDPHNLTLRAFWITIILIAIGATIRIPLVVRGVENATGILAIWTDGLSVLGCAALQTTVLLWTHPPQQARSKIRMRLPIFGLAAIVMVILILQVPSDTAKANLPAFAENPEERYGRTPYVAESIIICLILIIYTAVDTARHFLRYARLVDRHWLRRGLRLMAASCILAIASCLPSLAAVVALRLDIAVLDGAQSMSALFGAGAVSVFFVGATMPVWGPKLRRLRAYRQLRLLWLALSQAAPEVVLHTPHPRRLGRWRICDLDFRLYRRIIEIRDSRLALRPYLDQNVATAARRLGQEAGIEGDALRATIEASVLAGAIQAKARRRPAQALLTDDTPGGADLAGELAWLTDVAKAFVGSPVVAAAVSARTEDQVLGKSSSTQWRQAHADAAQHGGPLMRQGLGGH
jgi:hypothetical protein